MRTAILGAAASALLGGTLAVTPLTSVSSIPASSGPCANCDQAGSLLMPETAKPQAPAAAPAADVGGPTDRTAPAANLIAPGATAQRPASSGAYTASPGVSAASGAAAPDAAAPGLGGAPDVPGMDQVAGLAPAAAGISSIPDAANAVQSVWGTVVAVPTSLVGLAGGAAGALSSLSLSLFYLEASGLLPSNIKLPSGVNPLSSITGVGLPTSIQSAAAQFNLPAAASNVPGAMAAARGAVAARIPALSGGGPGPLAAIRAAIPQGGLPRPALPATPGWRALPHPHLPGPGALLKPHCIGPHIGPIGACIP